MQCIVHIWHWRSRTSLLRNLPGGDFVTKCMVSGEVGTIVTAPMLTGHLGVTGVTIIVTAPVLTGHMPVV